ncbi:MAG: leucine-rich repeat domain-containing protein, partial [Phycisphaeraceae bacterium]|nr:leucine-rich repeat domain-containing protein [Phycisphaeraceae bacterium]
LSEVQFAAVGGPPVGPPINFPDPGLEAAVREALGIPAPAPITDADMLQLINLDASDRGITDLTGLEYATNLEELDLHKNELTAIPAGLLSSMPSLTYLDLGKNLFTEIPVGAFAGLTSLQRLHLVGNQISALPANALSDLVDLREFSMDRNQLTQIPAGAFAGLTSLQSLSLASNQISTLPANALSDLVDLREFRMDRNQLTEIPGGAFAGLLLLEELRLNDNQISTLPVDCFVGLTSLRSLWLYDNEIGTMPMLTGLSNLQDLQLHENNIGAIPPNALFGTIINKLHIQDNQLTEFPSAGLSDVAAGLRELRLALNPISALDPGTLAPFVNLDRLSLGSQLSTVPTAELLSLPNLEWLDLNGNPFGTIPAGAFTGLNLNYLNLDATGLTEIPVAALATLPGLERLFLRNNGITEVPANAFSTLPILERLELSGNGIDTIDPTGFSGPILFDRLTLQNNQISDLLPLTAMTPGHQELDLTRNPLPQATIDAHMPDLLTKFDRVRYDAPSIQTLTTSSTAGGSVVDPGEDTYEYLKGTRVPVSAIAEPNHRFVRWDGIAVWIGRVDDPGNPDTIVLVDMNLQLEAVFESTATTVALTVLPSVNGSVTASGMALQIWRDVVTEDLDDAVSIATGSVPDEVEALNELAYWDRGADYVAAVKGWLVAPSTGAYTFYIYGDDHCGLFLSPDDSVANLDTAPVCEVDGWTNKGEWDKYPTSQTSAPVALVAGQRYAFRAVVREGGGGDGMGVAWSGPGIGATRTLISDDHAIMQEGTHPFVEETIVSVNARPAAHHHFIGWSGTAVTAGKVADPASASTTVTMSAGYSLQGHFAIDQLALTTSSTAGGSVTVPGEGTANYAYGTNVNLMAVPDTHYHFVGWTGPVANATSASTTVTITNPTAVSAMFAIAPHTLTTSSTIGGSVTVPGEGTTSYAHGTNVNVVAVPDAHYHFVGWTGPVADATSASTTVTIAGNTAVAAIFAIDENTLTISSTGGGTVSTPGEGSFSYGHGTSVPVVATPGSYTTFLRWTGSAVTAGKVANPGSASTTVTVDMDYTLIAGFASFHANSRPVLSGDITATSAILRGAVLDDAENPNCWYRFRYFKKTDGFMQHTNTAKQTVKTVEGTGDFAQLVEGLEPGCTYVYQALAGNSVGDSAGQYLEFTTLESSSAVSLTVLPSTGGQVLLPGAGTYEYTQMDSVPIAALADEAYLFLRWSGTAVDAGQVSDVFAADTTVAMEDNYSLQPVFAEINPVLYVDAQAAANGLQVGTAIGSFVTMQVVELPDGTIDNPFVTIQQAIDAAPDG